MEKENKRILFVGGLFPKELEEEIFRCSIGQPQNAANTLQWSIVSGLDEHLQSPIKIVNSLFIGAFPKRYTKLRIPRSEFSHSGQGSGGDINTAFLNLPVIKHIFKVSSLCRELNKSDLMNTDMVLGYSMTRAVVRGLLCAKKRNPKLQTCLIVPDLPEYMSFGKRNCIAGLLHRISRKLLYRDIEKVDAFVVLTRQMADALHVGKRPFAVMEGICPTDILKERTPQKPLDREKSRAERAIVYTGTLDSAYGIVELVKAFVQLEEKDVRLVICGGGNAVPLIKEMAEKDSRIQYLGILPPKQVHEIQKDAYLLVNPRPHAGFTKYSFPSKTMEYMAAGRPVLMYHLEGIPKDYDDYILYVSEEANGLLKSLREALLADRETMDAIGRRGKSFIIEKKNAFVQTGKIMEILQ